MKTLAELNAHFLDNPVGGRKGVGVQMDCPCGCDRPLYVPFAEPLDGKGPGPAPGWQRKGEDIATLDLYPSVLRAEADGCGWHGWIHEGTAVTD